ncbi:MAG TPA: hypothetical protein PKD78_15985, partial [Saprospiraceae bacterium]|nr:hypothetical protein [Saprospiraceae bacterium]
MLTKNIFFSLCLLCSSFAASTQTQAPLPLTSMFSYLTAQEGAALTLELDLTELINQKQTNQYFPASLSTADGRVFPVEARARGKYRRKICDMPPLKLKFSKKVLRAQGLDTLNEVKLVVPCLDDPKGEELVLREYVAYRLFQQISPQYHVKVGLVKVTFRDRHVEKDHDPVWCLLVEHEEEVAARLNGTLVEAYNLPIDSFQTEQAADHALFQYLIGNTDWGISTFRNVYLLKPKAPNAPMRVLPFDFDFSGLVSAPYAMPTSQSGLRDVKERILM